MQVTIQLPEDLKQSLLRRATQLNVSLETFILQSLQQLSHSSQTFPISQWSDAVLSFKGISDFPAFESYRDDLLAPRESELF
jgi:hypothetical protein